MGAMRISLVTAAFLALAVVVAAQSPLPELKVEATDAGSLLRIRNVAPQPLTAYLVELVGYPGSNFALYQEDIAREPLAPGAERKVAISNMTVGAAPEYVKMQAALYAGGSSAGTPEKIAQLTGLRRTTLETTRELIARLEKGVAATDLRAWAESLPLPTRQERGTPAALTKSTKRDVVFGCIGQLEKNSVAGVLASLKASERALASAK